MTRGVKVGTGLVVVAIIVASFFAEDLGQWWRKPETQIWIDDMLFGLWL